MIYDLVALHEITDDIKAKVALADSLDPDKGHAQYDESRFIAASRAGNCLVVTAREHGRLIGHAMFLINGPLAINYSVFVDPERRGEISNTLLDKCEMLLSPRGIKEIQFILTDDLIGRWVSSRGYKRVWQMWSKKSCVGAE